MNRLFTPGIECTDPDSLQFCLRHNNTFLKFNYLRAWCKPRVSEYLFNIVLTVGFRTQ